MDPDRVVLDNDIPYIIKITNPCRSYKAIEGENELQECIKRCEAQGWGIPEIAKFYGITRTYVKRSLK